MKYYLIVGEASGDLHASHLMRSLKKNDSQAEFRFFGGDLMSAEGGTRVRHFKDLAYMGFVPVLMHLPTIFKNMSFYYISPKRWAWKEYRIKSIRKNVDQLFSILPFEVPFFEQKHNYPIHYVGNPTADEVREFLATNKESHEPLSSKKIIALLAGSRKQEIKDNLPAMLQATSSFTDYQLIIAGAPGIEKEYYDQFLKNTNVKIVYNQTYELLSQSTAALVTSGTATLEAAMFKVPQVVCYKTPLPYLVRFAFNHIIKCKYISLVNLIADKEVVKELLADKFSVKNIQKELNRILPGRPYRETMLNGYEEIHRQLGNLKAPDNAAKIMLKLLNNQQKQSDNASFMC